MEQKSILLTLLLMLGMNIACFAQGFGERELINDQWAFRLGDMEYGGIEYLDHSDWRIVDLPHDWSVEEIAGTQYSSCTGFLPGGIAWYRKSMVIPAQKKGQQVYIYFGGVYNNSEVFINGKKLGKRPNGYISFMYDLTPYIKFGEENVVAVRVDHSQDADSRWYTGSGIYRDVFLVYAGPVHIGLWGVYYTAEVQGNSAVVNVETTTVDKNSVAGTNKTVKVIQELFDADGTNVGSGTSNAKIGEKNRISQALKVSNPHLWSVSSPYLYTLVTTLKSGSEIIDKTATKVGIRTLSFDPDKGFALNGESMKLKGVCIHHDAGCLGAAVPKEVWYRRLSILKEIGCNAIRTAHNPQATDLYEVCDELGFLVLDEAFDEWEYPKHKWLKGWNVGEPGMQGSASYFADWGLTDLRDIVLRDRNHPSIIMWSIGNEIDYPQDPYSHPILDQEGIKQKHRAGHQVSQPRAERLGDIAKELVAVVKQYDTSRPVTAGLAAPIMSNETDYPGVLDVVGYNYTEQRYEQDHKEYPERVFYGSENGSSYASWKVVADNEYVMGQFLWTGYDFLGESGRWPSRGSTAGIIDLSGNIKPRGYFRKALWSDAPNAYIGTYKSQGRGRRSMSPPASWNYNEGDKIRVVCFTNCEEAELYLNGKKIGDRKAYDEETGILSWDVDYTAGKLEVVAYNGGEQKAQHAIETVGKPAFIDAEADKDEFTTKGEVAHIMVSMKDTEGRIVPFADTELYFEVSDNIVLLGTENSSGTLPDNFKDNVQRCNNGKVLLYIKSVDPSKQAEIKISAPLFEDKIVTID